MYKCLPGQQMISASLALGSIERPIAAFGVDGQHVGRTPAEAATADLRMACLYVTSLRHRQHHSAINTSGGECLADVEQSSDTFANICN